MTHNVLKCNELDFMPVKIPIQSFYVTNNRYNTQSTATATLLTNTKMQSTYDEWESITNTYTITKYLAVDCCFPFTNASYYLMLDWLVCKHAKYHEKIPYLDCDIEILYI